MRDYGERGPSNTADVAEADRETASPLDLVVSSQRRMQKPAPDAGDRHVLWLLLLSLPERLHVARILTCHRMLPGKIAPPELS